MASVSIAPLIVDFRAASLATAGVRGRLATAFQSTPCGPGLKIHAGFAVFQAQRPVPAGARNLLIQNGSQAAQVVFMSRWRRRVSPCHIE